jgi:histidine ammonia-lyase
MKQTSMNSQTPHRIRIASLYDDLSASMAALRDGHPAVDRSRQVVLHALEDGRAHYGINTGFGILANKRIDSGQLAELQRNILLSHACGRNRCRPKLPSCCNLKICAWPGAVRYFPNHI